MLIFDNQQVLTDAHVHQFLGAAPWHDDQRRLMTAKNSDESIRLILCYKSWDWITLDFTFWPLIKHLVVQSINHQNDGDVKHANMAQLLI